MTTHKPQKMPAPLLLSAVAGFQYCAAVVAIVLGAMGPLSAEDHPAASGDAPQTLAVMTTYEKKVQPLLQAYCYNCHDAEKQKGDVVLSIYDSGSTALRARKVWKSVSTRLTTKEADELMPPESAKKQPTPAERQVITDWVASLKTVNRPDPGRTTLRRLNRVEYAATIHDLVGIDYQGGDDFPKDDVSNGFDNIAETLSLSPFLIEKYLMAADAILERALLAETIILRRGAGELEAVIDGKPDPGRPDAKQRLLTGPAELSTSVNIPSAGDYTVAVRAGADLSGDPARILIAIDGKPINDAVVTAPSTAPGVITCTVPLTPGPRKITVAVKLAAVAAIVTRPPATGAIPATNAATAPALPEPPRPHHTVIVEGIEILGPAAALPGPVAKAILVATPGAGLSKHDAAARILERFASRAYRRPANKEQLALPLTVFDLADQQGRSFVRAVKEMLKVVLVAPEFLFRIEQDHPGDKDGNYQIDDYDLASRLSYFLWSSLPDDALLEQAAAGKLHDPQILRAQVLRMVADAKSQRFIDNFAGQWLLLRNVYEQTGRVAQPSDKNPEKRKGGGGLPPELRQAMFAEGTGLFGYILRQGRSVGEFIDPGYTFLNEVLAKHYGIPGVTGDEMRLVKLEDHRRGGILTLGALMVVNSHPERTSPTKRGRWVLEEVIDKPPPPPPPNIPQLQFVRKAHPMATDREILEFHREKAACASCHKVMDPIGFGLENFDQQGRWRDKLKDAPINASGELPGKLAFNGPAELKKLIAAHTDDLAHVLGDRVLTYALGRALQYYDDPVIDDIVAKTAAAGYRFDSIVVETALSYPFRYRRAAH